METRLRHYHLGCGHRLQTDYSGFKNEAGTRFQELNKNSSEKLNEKRKAGSINAGSINATSGKTK